MQNQDAARRDDGFRSATKDEALDEGGHDKQREKFDRAIRWSATGRGIPPVENRHAVGKGEKAQEIAYDFARENEFMDDDKSEDTLRHILGGGFMADEKLGFAVYNLKENTYVNMIYGGL